MKKKIIIITLCVLVVLAVLLVPIPQGTMKDGGTRVYTALAYRVVQWRRIVDEGLYEKTRVYWLADRYRSLDELWEEEAPSAYQAPTQPVPQEPEGAYSFQAKVLEAQEGWVLVEPLPHEQEYGSCNQISFGTAELEPLNAKEGDYVQVYYDGMIMETYPAKIHASGWRIAQDVRQLSYEGTWLDPDTTESTDYIAEDLIINTIYADCFIATPVIPMPYQVKINGTLSEKWCPGDQVNVSCTNLRKDQTGNRYEGELESIQTSTFQLDPDACYKPVLYLYPEVETAVSVKLTPNGGFTCTYPAYDNGWQVTAAPDGTLTDSRGQTYNYLYWEGNTHTQYDMTSGFCIKGEDTAAFLEASLSKLGLTRREANEFIVYWLPLMQENPYNLITFQTEAYTEAAPLEITPAPDTTLRVFMAYQPLEAPIDIPAQTLTAPERKGFTAVEWGGTEIACEK